MDFSSVNILYPLFFTFLPAAQWPVNSLVVTSTPGTFYHRLSRALKSRDFSCCAKALRVLSFAYQNVLSRIAYVDIAICHVKR